MVCSLYTGAIYGIGGYMVKVEVDMSDGLPCVDMVGHLGGEVKESAERVRVALKNLGYTMPPKRFTINLSPAGIKKGDVAFDLPIALGILACMGIIQLPEDNSFLALGELGLDGSIQSVPGVLPILLEAQVKGIKSCIIPYKNQKESIFIQDMDICGLHKINEAINWFANDKKRMDEERQRETESLHRFQKLQMEEKTYEQRDIPDFADITGQTMAKRAAEIAAAGFHNLLLAGPPGTGKSMVASAMPGILPPMNEEEMLDTSKVYSVAGLLNEENYIIKERPFLNPHHTITPQALVGGGLIPTPGVISMANHGVLFLDELPEFKRETLDMLRQPMEEGEIIIARKSGTYHYPCNFMLVAAMNPCPCGHYPNKNKCTCSEKEVHRYIKNISGPLLNRIDLSVSVLPNSYEQLKTKITEESSADVRKRVLLARAMQEKRNGKGIFNSKIPTGQLNGLCNLTVGAESILEQYYTMRGLSMRAYHRLLRVSRTIADLDESQQVGEKHILEATTYRGVLDK